jgi:hypothetical protein
MTAGSDMERARQAVQSWIDQTGGEGWLLIELEDLSRCVAEALADLSRCVADALAEARKAVEDDPRDAESPGKRADQGQEACSTDAAPSIAEDEYLRHQMPGWAGEEPAFTEMKDECPHGLPMYPTCKFCLAMGVPYRLAHNQNPNRTTSIDLSASSLAAATNIPLGDGKVFCPLEDERRGIARLIDAAVAAERAEITRLENALADEKLEHGLLQDLLSRPEMLVDFKSAITLGAPTLSQTSFSRSSTDRSVRC